MENDLAGIAKALKTLDRSDIRSWLRRGELLSHAKQLCGTDASFTRFCRDQGYALRTAQKAMAAWRHFGDTPTSARFSKESMALLGQSPEARAEAIAIAGHQRVTTRIARSLLRKHLPQTQSAPPAAKASHFPTTFQVPGGIVIIKAEPGITTADLLSMLATAGTQLRERIAARRSA